MASDSSLSPTEAIEQPRAARELSIRRVAGDIGVQLFGRFGNLVLGIVVAALVARTLGAEGLGVYSVIGAIVGFTAIILNPGADQVALRCAAAEPEAEGEWLGALFYVRLFPSIAAFAISVAVLVGISNSNDMLLAGLLLSLPVLTGAFGAMKVVFQLRVRNSVPVAVMTVQSVAWTAIVVAVYYWGGGLVALAAGSAAVAISTSLLMGALALRGLRLRFSDLRPRCFELMRTSFPLAIGGIFVLGYANVDQILVFELGGERDAGLYGAAYKIFSTSFFAPMSISTTLFPLLAAAAATASGTARFRSLMQTSLELLVAAAAGGLAIAIAYSGPIVSLIYGAEFADAAPALPVLMVAFVLVSIGFLLDLLVVITGQQKRFLIVGAAAFVLNAGLNVALIPVWGFMAAAVLTAATEAFVVVMRWLIVRRHLPAPPAAGRIARVSLAAAALLLGLIALRAAGLPVVPALLVSFVGYPLLLLGSGAVAVADVRVMFSRERLA
jgi:O-antigen/teichoic acid export membrane protein